MNLEHYLSGLLRRIEPTAGPALDAAISILFRGLNEGYVCVDESVFPEVRSVLPAVRSMRSVVGAPGMFTPLILDGERLYLARYWKYEADVAEALRRLARPKVQMPDPRKVEEGLATIFQGENPDPHQRAAVRGAAEKNLVIISGGPGTGKTTTVAKILALLQMLAPEPLRIRLAAPTGKAADRLRNSVSAAKRSLPAPVRDLIPEESFTIHRLLGLGSRRRKSPLRLDLLVIDEASMIDLSLMAKILEALPPGAGLILLGDKDQLDAVQPGSVFGDLCRTGDGGALRDNIFILTRSYRFEASSGIGSLARAVNAGDAESALALLRDDPTGQITWMDTDRPDEAETLFGGVVEWLRPYFEAVDRKAPAGECFERFNAARLLTPLRSGPGDVGVMNARILERMRREGDWYAGRPILVNVNDYGLNLFNGDVGLALPDAGGRLSAVFPGEGNQWRSFAPMRLPSHDPAYAFTVHKSQGSEFDTVFLLIPPGEHPVITRNLFYTAITRAKKKCMIWGAEASVRQAILRRPARASGLWDRLSSDIRRQKSDI